MGGTGKVLIIYHGGSLDPKNEGIESWVNNARSWWHCFTTAQIYEQTAQDNSVSSGLPWVNLICTAPNQSHAKTTTLMSQKSTWFSDEALIGELLHHTLVRDPFVVSVPNMADFQPLLKAVLPEANTVLYEYKPYEWLLIVKDHLIKTSRLTCRSIAPIWLLKHVWGRIGLSEVDQQRLLTNRDVFTVVLLDTKKATFDRLTSNVVFGLEIRETIGTFVTKRVLRTGTYEKKELNEFLEAYTMMYGLSCEDEGTLGRVWIKSKVWSYITGGVRSVKTA